VEERVHVYVLILFFVNKRSRWKVS